MSPFSSTAPAKAGKPSAYQLQGTGRVKRALRAVAVADAKTRAALRVLNDALLAADTARAAVEAANKTYGTSYPATSKAVNVVSEAGAGRLLALVSEAAPTAEYPPLVAEIFDDNKGEALPGRAVFGEYEAPQPPKAQRAAKPAEPKEPAPVAE